MDKCPAIRGLVFDRESAEAIRSIREKKKYGNALAGMLSGGVFSNIFVKSSSLQAAYNISQLDWVLYANAMRSVPVIVKRAIEKDTEQMILHYKMANNRKLLAFWEGMYEGCK